MHKTLIYRRLHKLPIFGLFIIKTAKSLIFLHLTLLKVANKTKNPFFRRIIPELIKPSLPDSI